VKKLIAEFLGTFALVFAGTGAIVIDNVTGGAVSHVGVALTFGLIVLVMIYSLGDISGAHITPLSRLGSGWRGDLTPIASCLTSPASVPVHSRPA
jgi:aquaporin NIP